jgi:hypothetical protein
VVVVSLLVVDVTSSPGAVELVEVSDVVWVVSGCNVVETSPSDDVVEVSDVVWVVSGCDVVERSPSDDVAGDEPDPPEQDMSTTATTTVRTRAGRQRGFAISTKIPA